MQIITFTLLQITKNDIQVEFSICIQFEKNVFIRYLRTKSHDTFYLNVSLENILTVFTEIPLLV